MRGEQQTRTQAGTNCLYQLFLLRDIFSKSSKSTEAPPIDNPETKKPPVLVLLNSRKPVNVAKVTKHKDRSRMLGEAYKPNPKDLPAVYWFACWLAQFTFLFTSSFPRLLSALRTPNRHKLSVYSRSCPYCDIHLIRSMEDHQRKIDLQTRGDLTYLVDNINKAAQQKLDLHLPPSAAQGKEDAFRLKVEELVRQVGIPYFIDLAQVQGLIVET